MFAIVLSAAVVCVAAVSTGALVMRLCGWLQWSWLAPAVGLAALMLLTVPALHMPGRAVPGGIAVGIATIAGIVLMVREPAARPPLSALYALVPFALTLIPFAAAGHGGTLGWSFNNDMASHLNIADAYGSEAIFNISSLNNWYPWGPHAVVAAMVHTLGFQTDDAFSGVTVAAVVLLALTALGGVRDVRPLGRLVVAIAAGIPFIIAGYYGQGAFKEVQMAMFALAAVVTLQDRERPAGILRWVPLALIAAGVLSIYSYPGLAWVGGLTAAAAGVVGISLALDKGWREVLRRARAELWAVGAAAGVLIVVMIPQSKRVVEFYHHSQTANGTGIPKDDIGNLAGRLPFFEATGIWDSPDFRFAPAMDPSGTELWAVFVIVLAAIGAVWSLRRRDWVLPLAVLLAVAIWAVSDARQSAYVAAKALVVLSPMLLLLAVRPLVERDSEQRPMMPSWWAIAAPVVALVLVWRVVDSDIEALKFSKVGPRDHVSELRQLRPLLGDGKTLFIGNDDFIVEELEGKRVDAVVIGHPRLPVRPGKAVEVAKPIDIDSVEPSVIDQFDWVITSGGADASAPPENLRVVKRTRNYVLYQRVGPTPPRQVLNEGTAAAAPLDCKSPEGKAIVSGGGVAAIRGAPVAAPLAPVAPGGEITTTLPLQPGTWRLDAVYTSRYPVRFTAPRLRTTLAANLDRPGTRWPIGVLQVPKGGRVPMKFAVDDHALATPASAAELIAVVATPEGIARVVPIKQACGQLVDWYRPAAGS